MQKNKPPAKKMTLLMCKELNGLVLKSFKPKRSGPKSEKKLARPGSEKFCILFLTRPGPGRNFWFFFGPGQTGPMPEKSGSCWHLAQFYLSEESLSKNSLNDFLQTQNNKFKIWVVAVVEAVLLLHTRFFIFIYLFIYFCTY